MNDHQFGSRQRPQRREVHRHQSDACAHSLSARKTLIRSNSARTLLAEALTEICRSLDRNISNAVSHISPWNGDATDLDAIAANAERFGLYIFCSDGIFAGNGKLLGFLEMYCCVSRNPSFEEFQLIEGAKCQAAAAITIYNEANHGNTRRTTGDQPVRGRLLEWPVSIS